MNTQGSRSVVAGIVMLSVMTWLPWEPAQAKGNTSSDFVPPKVFKAAGLKPE